MEREYSLIEVYNHIRGVRAVINVFTHNKVRIDAEVSYDTYGTLTITFVVTNVVTGAEAKTAVMRHAAGWACDIINNTDSYETAAHFK